MNQQKKSIQRTLVIAVGELAELTADHLANWLTQDCLPPEAVALLPLVQEQTKVEPAQLTTALHQISQLASRVQLAERDWQLDRLNEIAVFLLIDAASGWSEKQQRTLVNTVSQAVKREVGVETAVLLIILNPEAETSAAQLGGTLAGAAYFQRGIFMLGLVNEAGLRLASTAELVEQAALLLWALIATPLRDAPEWLTEQSGHQPQAAGLVSSAGIIDWHWSRLAEQESMAVRWVRAALTNWLANDVLDPPNAREAQDWIEQSGVSVKPFSESLRTMAKPVVVPPWGTPQPWQVRPQFQRLRRGLQALQTMATEIVTMLDEALEPQLHAIAHALTRTCQERLDSFPVGGLGQTQAFLQQVRLSLAALEQQMGDRDEKLQAQTEELQAQAETVCRQMEALLMGWPEGDWLQWLPQVLRPWRWPGLLWRYWQLQQTGQAVAALYQQQALVEQQQVITAILTDAYVEIQKRTEWIESQVAEIGDMLRHLRDTLPAPSETDGGKLLPFYDRFVDSPVLEAETAAAVIGGLGRQLPNLDDTIISPLLAAGRERLKGVARLTAADLLSLRHESADDAFAIWLTTCWDNAAPLWQFDEASLSESLRNRSTQLTLMAIANVASVRHKVTETDQNAWRWLELADPERLIVLRLRSGIPIK